MKITVVSQKQFWHFVSVMTGAGYHQNKQIDPETQKLAKYFGRKHTKERKRHTYK